MLVIGCSSAEAPGDRCVMLLHQNVEGVRITVAITRRSKVRSAGVNLSALSIEGQVTIETAWSSLDGPIGESKDQRGRMGAFLSLGGGRELISSRPSVCYGSEQGCFMKLTSQRRTELGSSRASLERVAFVGELVRRNKMR